MNLFYDLPAGLGHLASQAMLVQALARSQEQLTQVPAHLCCADMCQGQHLYPMQGQALPYSLLLSVKARSCCLAGAAQRGEENTALGCSQPGLPLRLSGPPTLRAGGEGREEMAVPQQLGFGRGESWKPCAPAFLGQAQTKTFSRADVWKGSKARSSTSANLRQTRKAAE